MQVGSPLLPRVLSRGSLPPGISRYESLFNGILLMEEVVIKRGGLEMVFSQGRFNLPLFSSNLSLTIVSMNFLAGVQYFMIGSCH